MKDRTIAIIIDNNNPATLEMLLNLRQWLVDQRFISLAGLSWHIVEHDIVPAHGDLSSQDVFILEIIEDPKDSKVPVAKEPPL